MTLYRVRLQYALHVDAPSMSDAFKQICKQIQEAPNIAISTVEDASIAPSRSVVKRIITGR